MKALAQFRIYGSNGCPPGLSEYNFSVPDAGEAKYSVAVKMAQQEESRKNAGSNGHGKERYELVSVYVWGAGKDAEEVRRIYEFTPYPNNAAR